MLAILVWPFGFVAYKSMLSAPDEGDTRNASCALN